MINQKVKNKFIDEARKIQDFVYGRFGKKSLVLFDIKSKSFSVCFGNGWCPKIITPSHWSYDIDKIVKQRFKNLEEIRFCAASFTNSETAFISLPEGNVEKASFNFPFPDFCELNH